MADHPPDGSSAPQHFSPLPANPADDPNICTVCGFPYTFNLDSGTYSHLLPGGDWYHAMDAEHHPTGHTDPFRNGLVTAHGIIYSELGAWETLRRADFAIWREQIRTEARPPTIPASQPTDEDEEQWFWYEPNLDEGTSAHGSSASKRNALEGALSALNGDRFGRVHVLLAAAWSGRDVHLTPANSTRLQAAVNVPMRRHHAPSGEPAWGYAGSSPADLALSILAVYLPADRNEKEVHAAVADVQATDAAMDAPPVQLWDSSFVSAAAWRLHQEFKREFLAPLDGDRAHVIPACVIRDWLRDREQVP